MQQNNTQLNPLAVITGASSGLGEEYAMQLAAQGYDLLLIARRIEKLEKIRDSIEKSYPVSVEIMRVDLSDADALKQLEQRIESLPNLEMLVNNAGFGFDAEFPVADIDQECKMVQVHVIAPLRLSQAAIKAMIPHQKGEIINVASVAAYLSGVACAQYMATKAYLLSFSKCLQCDVSKYGIRVQALCPGFVRTGFHSTAIMNEEKFKKIPNFLWLKSDYVVRKSLKAIMKKHHKVVFVPSIRYKFFLAILTCPLFAGLTQMIYRMRAGLGKG